MGRNNINVDIDERLAEALREQTESRGRKLKKSVEGSLRLWITLTPAEQSLWIENKAMPDSGDDLDEEIRQLARNAVILTEKLANRASAKRKRGRPRKKESS